MATIEIANVSFTYRVLKNRSGSIKELFKDFISRKVRVENYQALKDVSFTVDSGEVIAIIGKNGAGKSTLFNIITGKDIPDSGSIRIGSTVKLGYVDQMRDHLDSNKNVWEEISEGVEEIDRMESSNPAFVNVKVPHSGISFSDSPRCLISLRFTPNITEEEILNLIKLNA